MAWAVVIAILGAAAVLYVGLMSNHDFATQIQQSRKAYVLSTCTDQNMRHDRTIATLDQEIAALPPTERKGAQTSRAGTVALIDAVAPKQDCAAVVSKLNLH